ncbi:MAG: glycosyltransferase family 39 protein [Armatimonadota bacterium]|nr:glycosyltransferase family 39 protein [Armatimonadota bacterium]MDR7443527.1 glycosyltransferase family 39 protein [Armatimonadota bacterium]MDR7570360.1 glycosyltransferase family 39 protein [Armatimonadota bacterium]MDR7615026.1 glycosyltransferase family 39 protein [Armatimonadota bacterium]
MRRVPWVVGLVALAAGLRLVRLGTWDIGLDEAYSALVAARPLPDLVAFVARDDFHPPLYYVFLHFWRSVAGNDEFWLRFPNVVFGSAAVPVVYALGRELVDERTALVAALLFALSPLHVFHAQDLRMYALLLLLGSCALLCFVRGLRDGRAADWALHTGFLVLALYTHYGAFLLLAGEALALAWVWAARRVLPLRAWITSVGAALAGFSPWAFVLLQHLGRTGPPEVPGSALLPLQQVAYALVAFASDFLPPGRPVLKAVILLGSGGATLYGSWILRRRPESAAALVGTSLGALGIAAIAGLRFQAISVGTYVLIPRTLLLASIGYLVLLGVAAVHLRPRPVGWTLLGALVALNLFSLPRVYLGPRPLWGPWRSVAAYVAERVQPGDGIVVVSGHWARPFEFYFSSHAKPVRFVRYYGRQDLERVHELVRGSRRVWLVSRQPESVDPRGRVRTHLRSAMHPISSVSFETGVRVEGYAGTIPTRAFW